MPQEGEREGRRPHIYDIVVVPIREGGRTKRFRTSRVKLALLATLAFFVSVGITLAVLVYTPLAIYVPIPNPALEQRYGRQIVETQERLNALAEDVLLLRDYNVQLRKALGDKGPRDSSGANYPAPSVMIDNRTMPQQTAADNSSERPTDVGKASDYEGELDGETQSYNVVVSGGEEYHARFPLLPPTEGYVTQGFDPARNHFGMDFAGKRGTTVYAATDGHVVFSGWTYDDGNMLIISHGQGYLTVYKHNQALLKSAQSVVKRGEPVALLGTSGVTSLGPHLHFEVWKDGVPQDPNDFLLTPSKVH